ncbi:AraC family transcriptional regulator [Hymenobacter sp.]|jgi:AraC-like DNA-binding protein|uniref:helix-turn-helix transcriptional regulator n=1 Tax=Hymenobacter sp. TaxID=1898978 RepID=UPI002EDB738A
MNEYRKYFSTAQLQQLLETTPNWGVDILTIGHHVHQSGIPYPDPNHPNQYAFEWQHGRVLDEFQLVYISNGQGVFESTDVPPTLVEAGTAFLLYPQVWHRFKPSDDTGWEEFWVGFKGHYAEYLMRQDCFSPQSALMRIGFHAELLNIFTRLIDTLKYEGVAYQQIATCQVIQLLGLVYASALMKESTRSRQEQVIHQARYAIQKNWANTIDFEALSNDFNVSYIWFRKAFKAVMGIPPGQYHLNLKLEKARQMLRETTLSVAEIADITGFESMFYFSRIFKKKVDMSPSEFRRTSGALPSIT